MASRAFAHRFSSTCSICTGSTITDAGAGWSAVLIWICFPSRCGRTCNHLKNDLVRVNQARLDGLAAGKVEEPLDQFPGLLNGVVDLGELILPRVVRRERLQAETGPAPDNCQQVVECVDQPEAQMADRFDPLCVEELGLKIPAFRNVCRDQPDLRLVLTLRNWNDADGVGTRLWRPARPGETDLRLGNRGITTQNLPYQWSNR